ncbi:MAG: tRNA (guanosine(37)-N1)-methyltransferase TrmD [Patescibacteria group bacterium]
MQFDIITLFPHIFDSYLEESILKRAQKKKIIVICAHDLRRWATDKHNTVDNSPYGGGPGMVLKVEPIARALQSLRVLPRHHQRKSATRIILTSARGKQFTAADAKRLAKYKRIIFICGRYEGVDERVAEQFADEELSIGPYILTGGELPAMVMTDAIARHIPGVLGKSESLEETRGRFPQYTRPEIFVWKKKKLSVPKVLLSGDHQKIEAWRKKYGE